jgi:hypothetical protein
MSLNMFRSPMARNLVHNTATNHETNSEPVPTKSTLQRYLNSSKNSSQFTIPNLKGFLNSPNLSPDDRQIVEAQLADKLSRRPPGPMPRRPTGPKPEPSTQTNVPVLNAPRPPPPRRRTHSNSNRPPLPGAQAAGRRTRFRRSRSRRSRQSRSRSRQSRQSRSRQSRQSRRSRQSRH